MATHESQRGVAPGSASGRALLVDDEAGIRRVVARVLTSEGYSVEVASNGAMAIEMLRQGSFDVVLSDISMPTMDGLELLSAVRAHDPDVPVVLMTGSPMLDTAVRAIEFGVLRYLTKPVALDDLRRAVREAVSLRKLALLKRQALETLRDTDRIASDQADLNASLTRALSTGWVAFQPIVSWSAQKVVAYEALVRPRDAALPNPDALLRAAERLKRVHDVGRMVRPKAFEAFGDAPEGADLFVNLHPHDLLDDDLFAPDAPLTAMASRVVLELTERASLHEVRDLRARVAALRAMGFRIAIDDLGAGYAGLNTFAQLEPEVAKIDMGLVRDVHKSATRRSVIRGLASLCRDLGITVVAEGIECAEERDVLIELGVDLFQGYFFAKPGPAFPSVAF